MVFIVRPSDSHTTLPFSQVVGAHALHRGHDRPAARPFTSSTSGVAQVSISLRGTRHSSLPSRASIAGDERLAVQVVPHDHQRVAVQHRRGPFAELVAHPLVAEVLLPQQLPVHVVRVEAERLEVGVQALAVGDGRARRPRAVVEVRRPRAAPARARCAPTRSCRSCGRAPSPRSGACRAAGRPPRGACCASPVTPAGTARGDEQAVAPDDRAWSCRVPAAAPSTRCSSSRST